MAVVSTVALNVLLNTESKTELLESEKSDADTDYPVGVDFGRWQWILWP
jgi:hypothetical protein